MLVGVVAGLLTFAFARVTGEPQVERAIAFETSHDHDHDDSPEPVSRATQRTFGLLTGVVAYGASIGGLFGLAFAAAIGRIGVKEPRALSLLLAAVGYTAIVLVPQLKYPANPPAVGNPDTIGTRTAAYFLLIAFSIAATVLSLQLSRRFVTRFGSWNGNLLAIAVFLLIMLPVSCFLPKIDEVPADFPASLLWRFRIAAFEIQAVLWASQGLFFGWLTQRSLLRSRL